MHPFHPAWRYSGRGAIDPVSGGGNDPATTAWVNAVIGAGGTVSAGRQTLVNNLIVGLKADGIWSKLDRRWLFCGENTQSALIDIVSLAVCTPQNSPTFTANKGYTGNGSNAYIDSGAAANGLTNYTQTAAHFGVWILNATTAQGGINLHGWLTGDQTGATNVSGFWSTGSFEGEINDGATDGGTVSNGGDGSGLIVADVSSNVSALLYHNGSNIADITRTTVPLTNINFWFLARNFGGSPNQVTADQIAVGTIGGHLTATEHANDYARLNTFLTAAGAI